MMHALTDCHRQPGDAHHETNVKSQCGAANLQRRDWLIADVEEMVETETGVRNGESEKVSGTNGT
jgi:hypothetical protein